jgi:hypothetical protein
MLAVIANALLLNEENHYQSSTISVLLRVFSIVRAVADGLTHAHTVPGLKAV